LDAYDEEDEIVKQIRDRGGKAPDKVHPKEDK
jgi:hypothetical protein